MSFRDGQAVFLPDGEHGKVLAAAEDACHVLVTTGALANEILLLSNADLVSQSSLEDGLEDCLDVAASLNPLQMVATPEEMAEEIVTMVTSSLHSTAARQILQRAIELIEE